MIKETLVAMRDLPRFKEISGVLLRYGLGEFTQRLRFSSTLGKANNWFRKRPHTPTPHLPTPVRIRQAFEELGPTFIKLGQILSTRVDVFPPNWITEFEKLQNNVPAVEPTIVRQLILETLGQEAEQLFAQFDFHPIGAASIAQVHRAVLHDGTQVAVKLRRPGIVDKVEADLRILAHLALLLEQEFPDLRRFQPSEIVSQFARSLHRELDLAIEARNSERFALAFIDDDTIQIPKIYWQYTQAALNVQDYIDGLPATQLEQIRTWGLNPKILAQRGADAILKMILIQGFFHADPHPGNVFFLNGNRIAFVDFGMVGRLSQARRHEIVDLLAAVAIGDEHGVMDALIEWTSSPVNERLLAQDVSEFMFHYEHLPLKNINISQLISDIMALIRTHAILLPADLAILFKALITLEGLGRQLDPEFQLISHITPLVRELSLKRYRPRSLLAQGHHALSESVKLLSTLPNDAIKLGKAIRQGRFRLNFDLKRLDHFGRQLDRSANRLTMGIVTGCLIIGSSIVMTVNAGPKLFGLPFFGFLGFILAMFNSLWLIWAIWRSGKEL